MHTYNTKNATFICNGDFSGEVYIKSNITGGVEIKIPVDDLFDFVAEAVRDKKIADAENATTKELLGL